MTTPLTLRADQLRLADTIQCFDGPWGTGVVQSIDDQYVTVFRPYGTTADFSYSGGVIPYIGTETIKYWRETTLDFIVWDRKTLK